MGKHKSKYGLVMFFSAIIGAIVGLFFAPKSGKELRKDARKLSDEALKSAKQYQKKLEEKSPEEVAKIVFGDVSEVSTKYAKKAQKDLSIELGILHEQYKKIDKKKYNAAVKSVINGFKKDKKMPEAAIKKLAAYLEKDAKVLVSRPKSTGKKTTKKPTRSTKKTTKKS